LLACLSARECPPSFGHSRDSSANATASSRFSTEPLTPGAIDEFVDSTDVLSYPQRFRELGNIYASRAKL